MAEGISLLGNLWWSRNWVDRTRLVSIYVRLGQAGIVQYRIRTERRACFISEESTYPAGRVVLLGVQTNAVSVTVWETTMGFERREYLATLGATIGLALAGCSGGNESPEYVELLNHELVRGDGLTVEGEAKNVSGEKLFYTSITVQWRENGALLHANTIDRLDWAADETWTFSIGYGSSSRVGYGGSAEDETTDYTISVDAELDE